MFKIHVGLRAGKAAAAKIKMFYREERAFTLLHRSLALVLSAAALPAHTAHDVVFVFKMHVGLRG